MGPQASNSKIAGGTKLVTAGITVLLCLVFWWICFLGTGTKELYQNPRKHLESFGRALVIYMIIALTDGFLLTLF